MTTVTVTVNSVNISADVLDLAIEREHLFAIGQFTLLIRNKDDEYGDNFTSAHEVILSIDSVEMFQGYVDDVKPHSDRAFVNLNILKITGKGKGFDLAALYITKKYPNSSLATPKIDDIFDDALSLAGSEITFTSLSSGSEVRYEFKRTYLLDGFRDMAEKVDYDGYIDKAKGLHLFAVGDAGAHNVTDLTLIAGSLNNNILDIKEGEALGFTLFNYVEVYAGQVKDHWTDLNASDLTAGTGITLFNDMSLGPPRLFLVGKSSIKAVGSPPIQGSAHEFSMNFPLFDYTSLDLSQPNDCYFYARHDSGAGELNIRIRLKDGSNNVIEFSSIPRWSEDQGYTDDRLPDTWYKIDFPVGDDLVIKNVEKPGYWEYITGSSFDWTDVVQLLWRAIPTVGYCNLWLDNLCIPNIEARSIAEDATSMQEPPAGFKKRMKPAYRPDLKSQIELDEYSASFLAKRKDPLKTIEVICKGQTGTKYAAQSLDVHAPPYGINSLTKYRIIKLRHHVSTRKDVDIPGYSFTTTYTLVRHTINPTQVVDPDRVLFSTNPEAAYIRRLARQTRILEELSVNPAPTTIKTSLSESQQDLGDLSGDLDDIEDGGTYGRVKIEDLQAGHILLSETVGDLDDIEDGTYGKVLLTDISAGHILLAEVIGDLDDIADGTYGKVLLTDIQSGHILLAETVGDLDDIGDGSTHGKILLTDIQSGHILLSETVGSLDNIGDGDTYGRVKLTDLSAGHILLAETVGDLDDIADGTYGKVLLTSIDAGKIRLSEVTGDLDDIEDGSTWGKVKLTSLSAGKVLLVEADGDLDDIDEGTVHGKVLLTSLSAGKVLVAQLDGDIDDITDGSFYARMPKDWRKTEDLTLIDGGKVYTGTVLAKSLHIESHIIEDLTLTDDSPSAGYIAWSTHKIYYKGTEYSISSGNTNKAYIYFDESVSYTVLQTSDSKPTLVDEDCIVTYNHDGTAYKVSTKTLIHGGMIETGSLGTNELTALCITTDLLAADSVDVDKIKASSVTTEKLTAGSVTTEKLTAGSVTTEKLTAGSVTTEKLTAGSVTANKVNAGAITTDKLDALAVTSGKIAAQSCSIDKLATDISSKTLEFVYIKFKEYSKSLGTGDYGRDKECIWGEKVYTREILNEASLRYRVRKILGELKATTGGRVTFADAYVLWGGSSLVIGTDIHGIMTAMIDSHSFWSLSKLGSGSRDFTDDRPTNYQRVRGVMTDSTVIGAYPTRVNVSNGSYARWKLYCNSYAGWVTTDWSPYDYFCISLHNNSSSLTITLRIRICDDTGESNYYYFDVELAPEGHAGIAKKFSDMTTVGSPNLNSINRISIECLTTITSNLDEILVGWLAISKAPIIALEVYDKTSYEEAEDTLNELGNTNTTLNIEFWLGGGNLSGSTITHYLQYPGSDIRGISYLEAV